MCLITTNFQLITRNGPLSSTLSHITIKCTLVLFPAHQLPGVCFQERYVLPHVEVLSAKYCRVKLITYRVQQRNVYML